MKKPTRKSLVKKLDKVFSEFIRNRDKRCVVCGSTDRPTCGHLFTRAWYSVRWDEDNCHCQCWACNYKHELDFYPFQSWFVNKFGQEKYDELYRKAKTPNKFTNSDLQDMIDKYKNTIAN